MQENKNDKAKKGNSFAKIFRNYNRFRMCLLLVAVIVVAIAVIYILRLCKDNTITIFSDDKINVTPTQVLAMKEIGEWEFLSIEDEELVDTVRKGFFSDDHLMRIYYGTLRLGFDMKNVKDDWITVDKDTISLVLPQIGLLDERFIDEARTKSFFETGSWNDKARENMYHIAYEKMKARCLTQENIATAEDNARLQFYRMLKAMGYENVRISFESQVESK
ncbi:MAG: DUF4230 domain-containing protein [Prevotella sp.]|nr:DUF4230 domain-containing protein [Prevotella sp.]